MQSQIRIEGPDGRTLQEIFTSIDQANSRFDAILNRLNTRKHYTFWQFLNLPISTILKLV